MAESAAAAALPRAGAGQNRWRRAAGLTGASGLYLATLALLSLALIETPQLAWIVFGTMPLLPIFARRWTPAGRSRFFWVKLYSVSAAVLLILAALASSGPGALPGPWQAALVLALAINVAEAAFVDFANRRWANALTGLILIATVPTALAISGTDRLEFGAPLAWLCIYTLWNWAFVAAKTPELSLVHAAVLAAPFLILPLNLAWWLQGRAYALGIHVLIGLFGEPRSAAFLVGAERERAARASRTVAALTFVIAVGYAALRLVEVLR